MDHDERIRQRAHEIWESEGRPEGRDAEHWSRAKQELREQMDQSGDGSGSSDAMQASSDTMQMMEARPDQIDASAAAAKPAAKKPRKRTLKAALDSAGETA